jgi:hypothetical protein
MTVMRTTLSRLTTLLFALALLVPAAASGASPDLLPDLHPEAPSRIGLKVVGNGSRAPRVLLGFRSATENIGRGPLVIDASRPNRDTPHMRADQIVEAAAGPALRRRGVGVLHYIRLRHHQHWHLQGFMRYELRTFAGFRLVAPDAKTGFCLGDRFDVDVFTFLPGEPVPGPFVSRCGFHLPGLLSVHEGISVGWGDAYPPQKEGQSIDVTNVPSGRYWLVNRSDPAHRLLESDRSNNAASELLDLRWHRVSAHRRRLTVLPLRTCPQSARCTAPKLALHATSTTIGR